MLTLVEVFNSQGTSLSLPLDDISSGIIVAEIEGLDPVKATLVSSSFANMDGEQYHSSRREARNLKFKLELEPDYITTSVRELRTFLYSFFMPKSQVRLRFHMEDELVVDILGRVETFEAALFTDEPTANLSLMCFDPDFYDPTPNLFQWGTTGTDTEGVIEYEGTVDTGIEFVLHVNRAVDALTIYHTTADGVEHQMPFGFSLVDGDELRINTNRGEKAVTLTRGGISTSLLYALDPTASWLALQPGTNNIRVATPGFEVPFDIHYTTKYGGL